MLAIIPMSISFSFNGTNNFRFADTAGLDASVKEIHIHIKTAFKGCGMHTPYKLLNPA